VHAPLEGMQALTVLPEVSLALVHVCPEAHAPDVEQEVAQ
jgi:hypothetical protein